MKVTATRKGFYGKLRKPGESFEIQSKKQFGSWMKAEAKVKVKPGGPEAESES